MSSLPDLPDYVLLIPIVLSCLAILLTLAQISLLRRQMNLDSLIKIVQSNRELLTLGFTRPSLWEFLNHDWDSVKDRASQEERRRYFQLWVNHMHIIWKAHKTGLYGRSQWHAVRNDMANFLKLEPLQRHWAQVKYCYPKGFQREVARLIAKPKIEG